MACGTPIVLRGVALADGKGTPFPSAKVRGETSPLFKIPLISRPTKFHRRLRRVLYLSKIIVIFYSFFEIQYKKKKINELNRFFPEKSGRKKRIR